MKGLRTEGELHVALPLGIGDAHWSLQKMRALKALHGNPKLVAHINESTNHRTVGYLNMIPFVDQAILNHRAPYDITREMPPDYRDDRWATLEGCRGWREFDYVLVANGHLERGRHISEWLPELETDYRFDLSFGDAWSTSHRMMSGRQVLLYPSGVGPNLGFHEDWWTKQDWVDVVRLLNAGGHVPLFVGADTDDDRGYFRALEGLLREAGVAYHEVVGKTSIPEVLLLIRRAAAWCGLNSGLGITSASMGTPTVMMWADERWPVGRVSFDPGMHASWLPAECPTYRTRSYGDPGTTPRSVVDAILEVIR